MRLLGIMLLLGINVLMWPLEFPMIVGTTVRKKSHSWSKKTSSRRHTISRRHFIKKKSAATKKIRFFLSCFKDGEGESIKCSPISHNIVSDGKTEQNKHFKKSAKNKTRNNVHSSSSPKGPLHEGRALLPKYVTERNLLSENYKLNKTNYDVGALLNFFDSQDARTVLNGESRHSLIAPTPSTKIISNVTDLRDDIITENVTNVRDITENVTHVRDITENGTNVRYITENGTNVRDMLEQRYHLRNITGNMKRDSQNGSTSSDTSSEQITQHHDVGLDLNFIMQSVMARRYAYLQRQVEDGILDMKYAQIKNVSAIRVNSSPTFTTTNDKHMFSNVVSSTIARQFINSTADYDDIMTIVTPTDVDDNMAKLAEDTHLIMNEFVTTFLNSSTPLLSMTPERVISMYNGNTSFGTLYEVAGNRTLLLRNELNNLTISSPSKRNSEKSANIKSMVTPNIKSMLTPNMKSMVPLKIKSMVTPNIKSMVTPNIKSMVTPNVKASIASSRILHNMENKHKHNTTVQHSVKDIAKHKDEEKETIKPHQENNGGIYNFQLGLEQLLSEMSTLNHFRNTRYENKYATVRHIYAGNEHGKIYAGKEHGNIASPTVLHNEQRLKHDVSHRKVLSVRSSMHQTVRSIAKTVRPSVQKTVRFSVPPVSSHTPQTFTSSILHKERDKEGQKATSISNPQTLSSFSPQILPSISHKMREEENDHKTRFLNPQTLSSFSPQILPSISHKVREEETDHKTRFLNPQTVSPFTPQTSSNLSHQDSDTNDEKASSVPHRVGVSVKPAFDLRLPFEVYLSEMQKRFSEITVPSSSRPPILPQYLSEMQNRFNELTLDRTNSVGYRMLPVVKTSIYTENPLPIIHTKSSMHHIIQHTPSPSKQQENSMEEEINNEFETNLEYFPMERLEDLFSDNVDVRKVITNTVASFKQVHPISPTPITIDRSRFIDSLSSAIMKDTEPSSFIDSVRVTPSFSTTANNKPSFTGSRATLASESSTKAADVYNEFVSAYQQLYGDIKVDFTQPDNEISDGNATEGVKEKIPGDAHKMSAPIKGTNESDCEDTTHVSAKNGKRITGDEAFLLMKRNNITLTDREMVVKSGLMRRCRIRSHDSTLHHEKDEQKASSSYKVNSLPVVASTKVHNIKSTFASTIASSITSSEHVYVFNAMDMMKKLNELAIFSVYTPKNTKSTKKLLSVSITPSKSFSVTKSEVSLLHTEMKELDTTSTSQDVCGKNFLVRLKLPTNVHQFSKSDIKKKLEQEIAKIYSPRQMYLSSNVVWVDDLKSATGPQVGVDVELYFSNRDCEHLNPLQQEVSTGNIGQFVVNGGTYSSLDDRIGAFNYWCPLPCTNPYNCFPACDKKCCGIPTMTSATTPTTNEIPVSLPRKGTSAYMMSPTTNGNPVSLPRKGTSAYMTSATTNGNPVSLPRKGNSAYIKDNSVNNYIDNYLMQPTVVYCNKLCRWFCANSCNPVCCPDVGVQHTYGARYIGV